MILLGLPILVWGQASNERSKYIGYKYKGVLPGTTVANGVKHLGGGLISDAFMEPVYGISELEKGRTRMLWLEISTGSNKKGITGWEVKDVLVFPNWNKSQHLFYSLDPSILCRRNNKDVENLVAIGQILPKRGIFKAQRAWIANIKSERFEPASITGLQCDYSEP